MPTLVEKDICESCGTAVREGSSFCYSCGESTMSEPPPPAILKPDPGLLNGRDIRDAKTVAFREPEPPPVAIPRGSPLGPKERKEPRGLIDTIAKTEKFPSAASMRAPRTRVKNITEVEWVERSSSSAAFILTAIVLALLTGFLVVAAIYLR